MRHDLFGMFRWIPGSDTGNPEGISLSAESDSGRCPENPQAFRERLERKLHFAYGRESAQILQGKDGEAAEHARTHHDQNRVWFPLTQNN